MNKKWTIEDSAKSYGVSIWGGEYFSVNDQGHINISPKGNQGPHIDLYQIIKEMGKQNTRLPVLIRFPDIIQAQMNKLITCFNKAIKEYGYQGRYKGVFPIKVNQQNYVIKDIIKFGKPHSFGLEVGSKPELLIALALTGISQDQLIICNGFKDAEYIQTALLSAKAGKQIFVVVERLEELPIILETAQKLNIISPIGFRIKLNSQGGGKWMDSSGSKSKFGLTASEIMEGVRILKEKNMLDRLKLLHFHLGSQITSIHPIKSAIREAARMITELYKLGGQIKYLDVGGGLGVDYDGSGDSSSSTNYSTQEYVNDIVYHIQSICDEQKTPHPDIISESGRFLVAHSSVLIFNITSANLIERVSPAHSSKKFPITKNTHTFIKDLYEIYKSVDKNSVNESFNDLIEKKRDIHQLFMYGVLNLSEAALAENIYYLAVSQLKKQIKGQKDYDDIFEFLTNELSDTYFSNFSVFQSLPDSWALGHIFPVMPIHRLNEQPLRCARLADLTCDSDGKISYFMNYESWMREKHMMVHQIPPGESYYMAVFLTGAYQEILGDMHNLFGDTDTIHISAGENGRYSVDHYMEGDSIYDILKYVGYHKKELMEKMHQTTQQAVLKGNLSREEAGRLLKNYSQALTSYTYLS